MSTLITRIDDLRALYGPARERPGQKELQLDAHAVRLSAGAACGAGQQRGQGPWTPRRAVANRREGGEAGTLLIPDAPGNNLLDTLEIIILTGSIGLLFLVPGVDETLRVNGRAVLSTDAGERERCADARRVPPLVIRVTVRPATALRPGADALGAVGRQPPRGTHHAPAGRDVARQIGERMSPDTVFENQAQALERYRQTL
jgi:hypothetical protein